MAQQLYVRHPQKTDKIYGPYRFYQLRALAKKGSLQPKHEVSIDRVHWVAAITVKPPLFGNRKGGPQADGTDERQRIVESTSHAAPEFENEQQITAPSEAPGINVPNPRTPMVSPVAAAAVPPLPRKQPANRLSEADRTLLRGDTLQDGEVDVLNAFHWASQVRSNMILFGVLLIFNAFLGVLMVAMERGVEQVIMALALIGLLVMFVLVAITYWKPNFTTVLVTSICTFVFALGCITGIMAVVMLCSLGKIKRAGEKCELDYARWRRIKKILKDPESISGHRWHRCGRNWLRLFDNRALFIQRLGQCMTLNRAAAAAHIERKGSRFVVTGWKDAEGNTPAGSKLKLTEDVAEYWNQWAGSAKAGN